MTVREWLRSSEGTNQPCSFVPVWGDYQQVLVVEALAFGVAVARWVVLRVARHPWDYCVNSGGTWHVDEGVLEQVQQDYDTHCDYGGRPAQIVDERFDLFEYPLHYFIT
jgi:hypothetical protein